MADFVQDGCLIDYTPSAAVAAGDVVALNDLITVAPRAIAANKLGAVAVKGVFSLPKAAASSGASIGQGAIVYWNHVAGNITTAADSGGQTPTVYKRAGKAAEAATTTATTVKVLLNIG